MVLQSGISGRWFFLLVTAIALSRCLEAQTANSTYNVTYGANYSSADRKSMASPSWVTPLSITYMPICQLTFGLGDDSIVANHTSAGWTTGTGNLAIELQFTPTQLGGGIDPHTGNCAAFEPKHSSFQFDYVATVPTPSTQESTELSHLFKATYAHNLTSGFYFVNVGANVSGVSTGGETANAVLSAHYQTPLPANKTWSVIGELDASSSSATSPSSVVVEFSADKSFGANDTFDLVFGTSFGITPYAPKFSPFITLTYNGSAAPPKKKAPSALKY